MSIGSDYLALSKRILALPDIPGLARLYFPPIPETATEPATVDESSRNKEDDFGFVILQDGSAGPFYTSFGDSLEYLHQHYPPDRQTQVTLSQLLEGFTDSTHDHRALALGAFNAISQHLMRRGGYQPPDTINSAGLEQLQAGERIGMVGYFGPLVNKLLARGLQIQVIEKNPQRGEPQPGLLLSTHPEDLAGCQQILCTASVLINDTLDKILQAAPATAACHLLGPSGSGLPDIAFAHGVASMGGIFFSTTDELGQRLDANQHWGDVGEKYQLTPDNYPGVNRLLEHA